MHEADLDAEVLAGADRLDDLLTMLGVNPQERPEHGGDSIAETLARAVLRPALVAREVELRQLHKELTERAIAAVERNYSVEAADCACSAGDKRSCGWRAGIGAAAHAVREALRLRFDEIARGPS